MDIPKPPKHLSREARNLWKSVNSEYEMDKTARAILIQGLEALDRLRGAQEILQQEGIIIVNPNTGGKTCHPAVKVESDARTAMLRCWRLLNFEFEPPAQVGRPWKSGR